MSRSNKSGSRRCRPCASALFSSFINAENAQVGSARESHAFWLGIAGIRNVALIVQRTTRQPVEKTHVAEESFSSLHLRPSGLASLSCRIGGLYSKLPWRCSIVERDRLARFFRLAAQNPRREMQSLTARQACLTLATKVLL